METMNKYKDTTLTKLLEYGFIRGAGHTYSALNGVLNNDNAILIVHDHRFAKSLGLPKNKYLTIYDIPEGLVGKRKAIVIDNHALFLLVQNHTESIRKQALGSKKVSCFS